MLFQTAKRPDGPRVTFCLIILNPDKQLHALIDQWDSNVPDPLLIIEWIFLSHHMSKTISTQHEMIALLIVKARQRLTTHAGVDLCLICLPIISVYLQWLLQQSEMFQMALADFSGQLSSHPPKHKLVAASFNLLM